MKFKTLFPVFLTVVFANIGIHAQSGLNNGFVAENDTCRKIDSYLSMLEETKSFSGGMLIIRDGKNVFCKGYGWADRERRVPFTPRTLASMGSITKAFTAAAVLKLAEQNRLSIADPIKKFFPQVPPDKAGITIHQLLTHSSGFHEFLNGDDGDYAVITKDDFLNKAFNEPLAFDPGTKAVYTNVGMSILGIIIEQVSGQDYEEYLSKNLFEPAGIKNAGYHFPEKPGDTIAVGYKNGEKWGTHQDHFRKAGGGPYWNLKANGGLQISLVEMYMWANAITSNSILSESSVQKMFSPQIREEGNEGSFGYGCNISRSRRNTKVIGNGGSNGIYFARLLRLPEEGLVFYMVTNESSINTNMVLPNVTQLYFEGKIMQDATVQEDDLSQKIYDILMKPSVSDLQTELEKANLTIDDDMVLLKTGQRLIDQKKADKALLLYVYYTTAFPEIVVAWNDLGDVYQMLGNREEALRCYKQALKLRPGNPRAAENIQKLSNGP